MANPRTLAGILCLLVGSARAGTHEPTLRFERLPLEQETGGGMIFSILQDRRGFIWLGTNGGLKRHDGYEFLIFESDPSDPRSLASNEIRALLEDRTGTLWVGTEAGLHRFDRTTRSFHRLPVTLGAEDGLSDARIRVLFEDRSGFVWVGTENGLNRLDPHSEHVTQFLADASDPDSLGRSVVQTITEDAFGMLWIGTRRGLDRLDPAAGSWKRYLESLPWPVVTSVLEDSSGVLWVGTHGGGLSKLDRDSGTFTSYAAETSTSSPHNSVMSIVEDDGELWVGTYGGLKTFDRATGRFVSYQARPRDPNGLSNNWIETLYLDRGGNLWIGTHNGTNKLLKWRKRFDNYVHDPLAPAGLPGGRVTAISGDTSGNLWVGTWGGGIARRDHRSGAFTRFRHDPENPNSLGRDWVSALYHDRSGDLWVGTNSFGGLSRLDARMETFTHYRHDAAEPSSLSGNRVISIVEDTQGTLWFGTFGDGLNRLDRSERDTGRFRRYAHAPGERGSLRHNTVQSLYEDSSGVLWVGTAAGLDRFDRKADRFIAYAEEEGLSRGRRKSPLTVFTVYEDDAGELWLGTSRGLMSVDRSAERVRSTPELSDAPVFGLLEDGHGNLWLHTTRGLTEYDPRTQAVRHFTHGDGFEPAGRDVYVSNAHFRAADGKMFFGGVNGLTEFDPDEIRQNPHIPFLVFTDFKLFHESVPFGEDAPLERPIDETSAILLSHRDNLVSFEFAALEFAAPENNQYAYQLEGFDPDWVSAGIARSATYTNLVPGDYTFRVKGSNNDGRWNEEGISMALTIAPAFWQTSSFRLLVSLSALALVLLLHRARVHRLERAARLLKQRVREGTAKLSEKNEHLEEEIQQRQQAEDALQHRIGIEILIAALSNNFIDLTPQDADRGIDQALEMIGSFAAVDRSYVFLLSENGEHFSNTHEWCDEGVVSMIDQYQDLPAARFPWLMSKLRALEVIQINHLDELPSEEAPLRALLENEGVVSFINVPMAAAGKLIGFLGFDSLEEAKVWSKEDIRLLTMVGEMFVGALERKRAEADLRSAQAQLARSEKTAALGQLTAGILHEINTPVGVLKANADLALRCISRLKTASEEQRTRALGLLEDASLMNASASERIERILSHLKQFVRLDASPLALADIHEGIDATLALLGTEHRAGITIRKAYGDVPQISCYPAELNQVFMTVLDNAMAAIDGKGTITISTSTVGDELNVRIVDSGRGMTQGQADRLFDMGFSTNGTRVGVGMGLAQAENIVHRHSGRIAASSRPGEGTEIAIQLPTRQREEKCEPNTVPA